MFRVYRRPEDAAGPTNNAKRGLEDQGGDYCQQIQLIDQNNKKVLLLRSIVWVFHIGYSVRTSAP